MRLEHIATALMLAAATTLSTACSTTHFDELYEARDYAGAARAFEADPSLQADERALFRAGTIHATPNTATYDPAAARRLLERLIVRYPGSAYAEPARRTLAFLNEIRRLESDVIRLATEAGTLSVEVERLNALIARIDDRAVEQAEQIDLLGQIIQRLETEIRNRDARIHALQQELDQLKAIDLRPARPTVAAPGRATPGDTTTMREAAGGDSGDTREAHDAATPDTARATGASAPPPDTVVTDTTTGLPRPDQ